MSLTSYTVPLEAADETNSWSRPARDESATLAESQGQASYNVVPDVVRSNWYKIYQSGLPEGIFNALLRTPPSASALVVFLDFWSGVRTFSAEPVISATSDGKIVAEWFHDPDNSLALMFDNSSRIYFSLFRDGYPTEGFRHSSDIAEAVGLMRATAPDPFSWSDAIGSFV